MDAKLIIPWRAQHIISDRIQRIYQMYYDPVVNGLLINGVDDFGIMPFQQLHHWHPVSCASSDLTRQTIAISPMTANQLACLTFDGRLYTCQYNNSMDLGRQIDRMSPTVSLKQGDYDYDYDYVTYQDIKWNSFTQQFICSNTCPVTNIQLVDRQLIFTQ
jgi:hypothetical protein